MPPLFVWLSSHQSLSLSKIQWNMDYSLYIVGAIDMDGNQHYLVDLSFPFPLNYEFHWLQYDSEDTCVFAWQVG